MSPGGDKRYREACGTECVKGVICLWGKRRRLVRNVGLKMWGNLGVDRNAIDLDSKLVVIHCQSSL